MTLASAIAIYFIIWWLVLFIVLPFGIRNAHETGETVEEGNEPGAPTNPRLVQKAVAAAFTTQRLKSLALRGTPAARR